MSAALSFSVWLGKCEYAKLCQKRKCIWIWFLISDFVRVFVGSNRIEAHWSEVNWMRIWNVGRTGFFWGLGNSSSSSPLLGIAISCDLHFQRGDRWERGEALGLEFGHHKTFVSLRHFEARAEWRNWSIWSLANCRGCRRRRESVRDTDTFAMDTAYWVRVALNESASCQTAKQAAKTSSATDTDTANKQLRQRALRQQQ